jgi:Tfp pilus assembly protein PilN
MNHVSLLPPEIKKKRLEEKKQNLLIRIVIAIFLVVMCVYAFLLVSTFLTRSNLESLRFEREAVENQIAALSEYELLYNNVNAAEARLNAAMGSIPLWTEFLQGLGLTLPPGVTLTTMTLTYESEAGTLSMQGWTYSHSDVADMLDKLETLEQLADIRCRVSTETVTAGQDTVQFTVDAVLLPGPQFILTDIPATTPENAVEEEGS